MAMELCGQPRPAQCRLVAVAATFLCVILGAGLASAQDTKKPLKKTPKATSKQSPGADPVAGKQYAVVAIPAGVRVGEARSKALDALRAGGAPEGDGAAAVTAYFEQVVPAIMTGLSANPNLLPTTIRKHPEPMRQPEWRAQVRKDAIAADEAGAAFVNDILIRKMMELTAEEYHPDVRYNAILLIGELNVKEEVRGAGGSPAVPSPVALARLLAVAGDTNVASFVRVGALIGIQRHAEIGLPNAAVANARATMLKILREQPNAKDASTDGLAWQKQRAIGVLAAMGAGGATPDVVKELVNVLADTKLHLAARCTAAGTLGRMPLEAAALKPTDVAGALGNLAVDVCNQELARIAAEGDENSSGKKMAFRCGCIKQAFNGDGNAKNGLPGAKVDPAQQAAVDEVKAALLAVDEIFAGDASPPAATLQEKLTALKKALQTHNLLSAETAAADAANAAASAAAAKAAEAAAKAAEAAKKTPEKAPEKTPEKLAPKGK